MLIVTGCLDPVGVHALNKKFMLRNLAGTQDFYVFMEIYYLQHLSFLDLLTVKEIFRLCCNVPNLIQCSKFHK